MHLRKGRIYHHKDEQTGYLMVMSFNKKEVTVSPLFGYSRIVFDTFKRSYWDNAHKAYKGRLPPIIQARYDHEKMRRVNKLYPR